MKPVAVEHVFGANRDAWCRFCCHSGAGAGIIKGGDEALKTSMRAFRNTTCRHPRCGDGLTSRKLWCLTLPTSAGADGVDRVTGSQLPGRLL
jgi:hypothetical protein